MPANTKGFRKKKGNVKGKKTKGSSEVHAKMRVSSGVQHVIPTGAEVCAVLRWR